MGGSTLLLLFGPLGASPYQRPFVTPDDDDGVLALPRNRIAAAVPRNLAASALSRNRNAASKGRR